MVTRFLVKKKKNNNKSSSINSNLFTCFSLSIRRRVNSGSPAPIGLGDLSTGGWWKSSFVISFSSERTRGIRRSTPFGVFIPDEDEVRCSGCSSIDSLLRRCVLWWKLESIHNGRVGWCLIKSVCVCVWQVASGMSWKQSNSPGLLQNVPDPLNVASQFIDNPLWGTFPFAMGCSLCRLLITLNLGVFLVNAPHLHQTLSAESLQNILRFRVVFHGRQNVFSRQWEELWITNGTNVSCAPINTENRSGNWSFNRKCR